jgi:acyl-CoA reductase-like NAD-dependent aldehyde dehydrogenase
MSYFYFLQRDELGALVSLEMGKIRTEGVGEVQEFVDIVSGGATAFKFWRTAEDLSHSFDFTVRLCGWAFEDDERKGDQL